MASNLLIQFAREPVAGQVKTRMMPELSAQQACDLHRELVLWTCGSLLASGLGEVELAVAGDTGDRLFRQCRELGPIRVSRQRGADLGERMYLAIEQGLREHPRVLLVGSDCPAIDASYLGLALDALDEVPLVLGPALDGGYVLIGAREIHPALFRGIDWGSERVFAQSLERLREAGMSWLALPALADIDRPADLKLWYGERGRRGRA